MILLKPATWPREKGTWKEDIDSLSELNILKLYSQK